MLVPLTQMIAVRAEPRLPIAKFAAMLGTVGSLVCVKNTIRRKLYNHNAIIATRNVPLLLCIQELHLRISHSSDFALHASLALFK